MNKLRTLLQYTTYNGAGNEASFALLYMDSTPLDLSALIDVLVTVTVHNPIGNNWTIVSDTTDVYFEGNILYIKFGKLNLPQGHYYPRISYTHSLDLESEIILGRGDNTELLLTAYNEQ